jgi:hypothetical protein
MKKTQTLITFVASVLLFGCGGGGGGGGSASPTKPTPLDVAASSYANKNDVLLDSPQIQSMTFGGGSSFAESVTFGDFFQDGKLSAFVVVSQPGLDGRAYFLSKNASGLWEDKTSSSLIADADRAVCPTVSQAITTDFNNDNKPDIYVSCRGAGGTGAVSQVLYLSQSGSTSYQKISTSFTLYAWGVAAADVDGDQVTDIVTSNWATGPYGFVHVLKGALDSNRNFTLTQDSTRIPQGVGVPTHVTSVHLIPMADALPDLVLGGEASNGNPVLWMKNNNGMFSVTGAHVFAQFDAVTVGGTRGELRDLVKSGNNLYALMKDASQLNMALVKYAYPNGQSSTVSPIGANLTWSAARSSDLVYQMKLNSQGKLVAFDGACPYIATDANYATSRCGWRVTAP